jgi:Na+/melibiose symporter-like transporter
VLALGAGFYAAGQILLMLAPPGNLAWAILTSLIVGLAAPTAMLLPRLIVAEIAQAETSRSGADHVSFLLATLSSTEKLGIAIAVGLIFIGLGWADFDPQRASAAEFELLLRVASAGLPALLFLAAAALAWRFPPTPAPPAGIRSGSSR